MMAKDLRSERSLRSHYSVIIARARISFLTFLLAFAALLGMNALSMMHNTLPHDDQHAHIVNVDEYDHGDEGQSDSDSAVHLAMHAVVHGVDLPAGGEVQGVPMAAGLNWSIPASPAFKGFDTASLLRPPQA